jgi:hypothetical protein
MLLLLLCLCAPLILGLVLLLGTVWLMVTVAAALFTGGLRLLAATEVTHER